MGSGCQHKGPHHSSGTGNQRKLLITLGLIAIYCIAEVVAGLWTGSLALLADAGHMASDAGALAISLIAAWLARCPPSRQQTFGYHRAEILAALLNGSLLFLIAGGILHEAWERFFTPTPILGIPMLAVAVGGLIINVISLGVLHGSKDENLNMRGAWLHVIGDTLGSVTVIVAAILIWLFSWNWADPVASVLACLLILYSAWNLITDATLILMEHAPRDVDVAEVRQIIYSVPHVVDVHCLHVWTIASGLRAVSAHIVLDEVQHGSKEREQIHDLLKHHFQLEHITLQIEDPTSNHCTEREDGDCLVTTQSHDAHSHAGHSH
ncbi:cation diffusion facilitator family transporter [Planctomicrobium sp. SH668]|uniref:cation diffusion facilitator family transporter n=1 Tax=Planctomicrobium sp. SH668 TaxID=3448126 RepID=UPI003F5C8AAC